MRRILSIFLIIFAAMTTMAQSLVINQSLELVAMSSAVSQYNNQFGRFNNPDLDEPFPYAVICMNLSGDVRAAKEVINLDLGTMLMVQSTHRDIDNTILFLVPVSAKNIYLTCGDGCSRQLLWNQGKMQSNKVYKCAVEYRKEESKVAPAAPASDELKAMQQQMVAMQQELARLQQGQAQQPQNQNQQSSHSASVPQPKERDHYEDKLTFTINGVEFTMILVEGGTFMMGATKEQGAAASSDEKPVHEVTLTSYYMGETEVTQALWEAVMGTNPSCLKKDATLPVDGVRWNECSTFVSKLNSLLSQQLDCMQFALPTEAQWEYAARGGKKSKGYKYSGSNDISEVAWYAMSMSPHPVKTKLPNELGLYDMSGNVWEWCYDLWDFHYPVGPQTNPAGPTGDSTESSRVKRGGSSDSNSRSLCRVSYRSLELPDGRYSLRGLRLCLVP